VEPLGIKKSLEEGILKDLGEGGRRHKPKGKIKTKGVKTNRNRGAAVTGGWA